MKTILSTTLCFVLCCALWIACKKKGDDPPAGPDNCESAEPLVFKSAKSAFTLPDAFTPNGDGKNDVFKPVIAGIAAEGYQLTIALGADQLIYRSGNIDEGWNGMQGGQPAQPGRYAVLVRFRSMDGTERDTCNFVTLLATDPLRNCIQTHGFTYHFADQVDAADPDEGFKYNTSEVICP